MFIYICLLEWSIFSKSIDFIYLMNCFKYLLVSSLLHTGQLPTLSTLVFRISLSFFSLLHWNNIWSTVCMPCFYGHSGLPKIFNRCKYDRIFPWPIIIVVTFGLKSKFTASLPSTLGKISLVIASFVVSSHWRCHFLMLSFRVSFFTALSVSFYKLHSCFDLAPSIADLLFRFRKFRPELSPI